MNQENRFRDEAEKAVEVADGLDKMAEIVNTLDDNVTIGEIS